MARRRVRGIRRRACLRKMAHTSHETARDHLERLVALGANRDSLQIYRCPYCERWHVGHRRGLTGGSTQ